MKKISTSQLRSKIRQIEQKQRTAINNYNRAVRQYNTQVKRAVNEYNSAVRRHNANVLHNRQIIQREISRLRSSSFSYKITYSRYVTSIENIQTFYNTIVSKYPEGAVVEENQEYVLDLIEKENAQALETANNFLEDADQDVNDAENKEIENRLAEVSADLMKRWKGAIFSLNPQNPDAARHFCTSTRELFTDFIELKASDDSVFAYNPNAQKTERGNATRKEKIKYMMRNYNFDNCVVEFIDADIERKIKLSGQSKTDYLIRALADKPIIYIGNGNEILAELKRQGNNLNQVVKNNYFGRATQEELLSAIKECKSL